MGRKGRTPGQWLMVHNGRASNVRVPVRPLLPVPLGGVRSRHTDCACGERHSVLQHGARPVHINSLDVFGRNFHGLTINGSGYLK